MDENAITFQRDRYNKAGQGHVFQYFSELSSTEKMCLLNQLESIEVENLGRLLESAKNSQAGGECHQISPYDYNPDVYGSSDTLPKSCHVLGLKAIASNEVAVIILAGGQGTRLGFDGPKGIYSIGLPSQKSLFQLIAERIRKLQQLAMDSVSSTGCYKVIIPCYVMTSPMNHQQTVNYFERNNYFGLEKENVTFFPQGVLPCLDENNKIIMESRFQCSMAPDGNGGIYSAMHRSGIMQDWYSKRNIKYIHVFAIDNALVRPADPGNKKKYKNEYSRSMQFSYACSCFICFTLSTQHLLDSVFPETQIVEIRLFGKPTPMNKLVSWLYEMASLVL